MSRDLKPKSPLAGRLIRRALSRLEPDHPKFTASEQAEELRAELEEPVRSESEDGPA